MFSAEIICIEENFSLDDIVYLIFARALKMLVSLEKLAQFLGSVILIFN